MRDRIADLLDSGQHQLVIDLGGVEFLDSTGLGVLVAGLNRAREVGGSLSLVCPQERVLKLFRITGLDEVFTVHSTVDEALASTLGGLTRWSGSAADTDATVTLRLPPSAAHVRTARLIAAAVARRSGVGEELLDEVRLAVGEACARAVRLHERHGMSSAVTVEFAEGDRFRVAVVDRAEAVPEQRPLARSGRRPRRPGRTRAGTRSASPCSARSCRTSRSTPDPAGGGTRVTMSWPLG